MKGRLIAVEERNGITVAALVIDGVIQTLEIDRRNDTASQPGALYAAKVTELRPDLGAAFLDIGGGEGAFLSDAGGVRAGEVLHVRITRSAEDDKLARASSDIQLAGKYLVFTPAKPGINISRKIDDQAERERLEAALRPLADSGGFVVRTHATGVHADDLRADAAAQIERFAPLEGKIGLLAPAPDAASRCQAHGVATGGMVKTETDAFEALDLDVQLRELCNPDAFFGEGSMRIERTAALVAVDVNTGAGRGGNVLGRANLAAAAGLPRQLRLRRLGGSVIVDFAGTPRDSATRKRLEKAIAGSARQLEGFRPLGWGPAGLYEFRCARPARTLNELLPEFLDG